MRNFLSLLAVVAFVAILYSPATIGASIPTGLGSTSATDTLQAGTSQFLALLRSAGYHVILANNTLSSISTTSGEKAAYFLIGADSPLSSPEIQAIDSRYKSGNLSLLIAEGNKTNENMINQVFGADVTGNAITDPTSSFADKRVFTVTLANTIGSATGVIDIASPILTTSSSGLSPVATTSSLSYDSKNSTLGPRTVVAAGSTPAGSRALVITDSAPFTNYLLNYTGGVANEQDFVMSMVNWVTQSNKNTVIILDNAHYLSSGPPAVHFGIPVAPIIVYALELYLSSLNGYYSSLPAQLQGFLSSHNIPISLALADLIATGIALFVIYGALRKWFAQEKKYNDNLPVPNIEQTIVAESKARTDFLQTARSKSFYVASLAQLYEVLDTIVARELGSPISSINRETLSSSLGEEGAREAASLFSKLKKIHDYSTGKRRVLFPPVLRWKSLASNITRDAEKFLNRLNITILGAKEKEQIEYVARGH